MPFASPEAQQAYQGRVQMIKDVVQLKKPVRIPVCPNTGFYPFAYAGVTAEEELLDYIPRTLFGYRLEEVRDVMTALLTSERLTSGATRFLSVLFTTVSQAFLVMLIFAFMLSAALSLPSSARLGLQTDHPLIKQAAALTEDVRRYVTLTTSLNLLAGIGNTILLLSLIHI